MQPLVGYLLCHWRFFRFISKVLQLSLHPYIIWCTQHHLRAVKGIHTDLFVFGRDESLCAVHLFNSSLTIFLLFALSSFSRHCRGRWRSRVAFSSQSPALWRLLSQGPISRMNWMTDRRMPAAGHPLTTTLRMHSQQLRKTTEKWVADSHCCTSAATVPAVCVCVSVFWAILRVVARKSETVHVGTFGLCLQWFQRK